MQSFHAKLGRKNGKKRIEPEEENKTGRQENKKEEGKENERRRKAAR